MSLLSRRRVSVLGMTALLTLSACSSGGASTAPSVAAPSQAAASAAATPAASTAATSAATPAASTAAEGPCAPSSAAATVEVAIAEFAFPSTIDAKVGDVIGFTNKDSAPHTATLDDYSCTTDNIAQGRSGGLTFSTAGDYPFHCRIHPKMVGTIKVAG